MIYSREFRTVELAVEIMCTAWDLGSEWARQCLFGSIHKVTVNAQTPPPKIHIQLQILGALLPFFFFQRDNSTVFKYRRKNLNFKVEHSTTDLHTMFWYLQDKDSLSFLVLFYQVPLPSIMLVRNSLCLIRWPTLSRVLIKFLPYVNTSNLTSVFTTCLCYSFPNLYGFCFSYKMISFHFSCNSFIIKHHNDIIKHFYIIIYDIYSSEIQ